MRNQYLLAVAGALALAACSDSATPVAQPTPDAPTAAVTSTAPAPGATSQMLWRDAFDQYNGIARTSTAPTLAESYPYAGAVSLVTGRGGSGKAVRFAYSGSSLYNLIEHDISPVSDVYIRFWYRLTAGADPTSGGASPEGMTFLSILRGTGSSYVFTAGGGKTASDGSLPVWFGVHDGASGSEPSPFRQNIAAKPRFGSTNDGTWHQYVAHIVPGAGGAEQVWVDNTLVLDNSGKGYDHAAGPLTGFRLPGELAAAPSAVFKVDVDDIDVWSGGTTTTTTTTTTASAAPVASVSLSPASLSIAPGATGTITATTTDANGAILTGRSISWTSSNAAVATVSSTGTVTGVAAGSATITATSEGKTATAAVTVSSVAIAKLTVSPATSSLSVGRTQQMTATATAADGTVLTGRSVTWVSGSPSVASVSATGVVTALASGSAVITATSEGISGTATVSVTNTAVASVSVSLASASITAGQTTQATATTKDASGVVLTGRAVTWASANAAVATVSSTGVVTGVSGGSTTITATSEGKSGSATITVGSSTSTATQSGTAPEPTASDVMIWQDSFDGASVTAQTTPYATRGNLTTVPGRSGNGLRFNYTTASTDNLIEKELGSTNTDMYVRYWYRLSPGADLSCGDRNGPGMKWFMTWRPEGHLRYTMSVNSLDGVPFQGRANAGMEFTSHDQSSVNEPDPWLSNVNHSLRFSTTNDGAWHKYTLHVVTGNGGYEQIWIDGTLVLDNSSMKYDHDPVGISMIQYPGVVVHWYEGCDFTIDTDDLAVWRK